MEAMTKSPRQFLRIFPFLLGSTLLIILDWVSKRLAVSSLSEPTVILPSILSLEVQMNSGIAWSIPVPNIMMIIFTPILLLTLFLIAGQYLDFRSTWTRVAFMFVVSGALGNFLDRIFRGAVVDFIDFSFWPAFNLADTFLTLGFLLTLLFYGKMKITTRASVAPEGPKY